LGLTERGGRRQQKNGEPNALRDPGFGRARELFRGVQRGPMYFVISSLIGKNIANIETLNPGATVVRNQCRAVDRNCTARHGSLPDESRIDVDP